MHINYRRTDLTAMHVETTHSVAYFDAGDETSAYAYSAWLRSLGYCAMVVHTR